MGKLKKIGFVQQKHSVYDIEVEDNHNFFANGILAHNCEISLKPYQFCNLTEVNAAGIESQVDFNSRVRAATILGTLQATYTNFHYLRDNWKSVTEKDALLGVSLTGIGSGAIKWLDEVEAARVAVETNKEWAKKLKIKQAARVTTLKPSGTSSIVLGTSSGIHPWHNSHYVRRVRVGKNEDLYRYLKATNPGLIEDDTFKPHIQAVLSIPQRAPKGAITRHEDVMDFLERIKRYNVNWIRTGYRSGANNNNVSATVSIKEDEWDKVGNWMWENREYFNGLSVLPFSDHTYVQAPFEDISEEEFLRLEKLVQDINLEDVVEFVDNTDFQGEVACSGNNCEVKFV